MENPCKKNMSECKYTDLGKFNRIMGYIIDRLDITSLRVTNITYIKLFVVVVVIVWKADTPSVYF